MSALGAPVVEGVADALVGKNFRETIGWAAVFPLAGAGGDMDVAGGELAVDPGVA